MCRNTFTFRKEWKEAMKDFPVETRAQVYDAVLDYAFDGVAAELEGMAKVVFVFIKSEIDKETAEEEQRLAKSDKMRQLAMKRWHIDASADASADASVYTSKKSTNTSLIIKYNNENINNKEDISIKDNIKKERESEKRKKESKPPKKQVSISSIEARKEDFYNSLVQFVPTYGRDLIRAFFDYWSEFNRSQTKMRYELEKTWQTSRRLATWAARDKNFKPKNYGADRTNHQEQARQRADDALAIMQELRAEGGTADPI
ncbi:MAG: DUF6291 domain-containing protein [Prevotella sp.]|nr:DUF6291 domain-containing protein [Prevotella sp.]